jgi:hypothetical protein
MFLIQWYEIESHGRYSMSFMVGMICFRTLWRSCSNTRLTSMLGTDTGKHLCMLLLLIMLSTALRTWYLCYLTSTWLIGVGEPVCIMQHTMGIMRYWPGFGSFSCPHDVKAVYRVHPVLFSRVVYTKILSRTRAGCVNYKMWIQIGTWIYSLKITTTRDYNYWVHLALIASWIRLCTRCEQSSTAFLPHSDSNRLTTGTHKVLTCHFQLSAGTHGKGDTL